MIYEMAECDMKKATNKFLKYRGIKIEKKSNHCNGVITGDIKKILVSKEFVYGKNKEKGRKIFHMI